MAAVRRMRTVWRLGLGRVEACFPSTITPRLNFSCRSPRRVGRSKYRRFATAAEALRYAVEDLRTPKAFGAWLEVGRRIRWLSSVRGRRFRSNRRRTTRPSILHCPGSRACRTECGFVARQFLRPRPRGHSARAETRRDPLDTRSCRSHAADGRGLDRNRMSQFQSGHTNHG